MASMDATSNKQTHIAIIPIPGTGSHLISLAEFARHLLLHNPSLFFTFILTPMTDDDANTSAPTTPPELSSLPVTAFNIINLPPPSFPAFSDFHDEVFSRVLQSISRSLPLLRQTLREISRELPVAALIVDMFATDVIRVGSELGIKSYLYYAASAISLSVFLHLPTEIESHDEWGPDEPLSFPGCSTVRVKDLPDPFQHRTTVHPKWFVDHCKRFKSCEAIILNSFQSLEDCPIRALLNTGPPVHLVGPIVREGSKSEPSGCLRWLDEQPLGSVLYVSFGGGGTHSTKQVTELAWGLELSQQRFLWVVRRPNDSASYITLGSESKEESSPLGFLPQGFVERTKGRGLVVHSWAPQVEILSHGATGGFLTHCGWNSILEGVLNGVGFIAWPLYAEQKINAIELVEEVKVALRVKKNDERVVEREDIAEAVKALMEGKDGEEIKERMKTLKDEARRRMDKDGDSSVTLSRLAHLWNI